MAASSTSITVSRFTAFKSNAADREQLGCKKIPGFFLMKLKRGCAWRLRYTDLTGKRRTATIADGELKPEQAAQVAMDWRQKLKDGIDPLGHKQALKDAEKAATDQAESEQYNTVGRYFDAIYSHFQHAHHRNAKYTLNTIRNNFGHLFERRMDGLKKADITAWYNHRRGRGIARSTLQRDYGAFKAMLNHASTPADDAPAVLEFNPLHRVTLPRMTLADKDEERQRNSTRATHRDLFSTDDVEAIKRGLSLFADKVRDQRRSSRLHGKKHLPDLDDVAYAHWFIPYTLIAWLTGMRPGDIRVLKWENLEHNRFNGQTSLVFTPAKTQDKGENPVQVKFPVAGRLAEVLHQWREQLGSPETGYVFPSERTHGPRNKKSHRTPWFEVKRLGGVRDDLEFYSFRHNFISELVARGRPVLTIAGLVGHRDGTMIAQNYLRHNEQDSADVIADFGDSIGLDAPPRNGQEATA